MQPYQVISHVTSPETPHRIFHHPTTVQAPQPKDTKATPVLGSTQLTSTRLTISRIFPRPTWRFPFGGGNRHPLTITLLTYHPSITTGIIYAGYLPHSLRAKGITKQNITASKWTTRTGTDKGVHVCPLLLFTRRHHVRPDRPSRR